MSPSARCLSAGAIAVATGLAAGGAQAGYLDDHLRIAISGYQSEIDGKLRVDPDLGEGTELEVDRDLNLDDREWIPRLDLTWRITPHQRLDASYFQLRREGSRVLDQQVTFGDQTFDVSASLESELTQRIGQLSYGWSFVNNGQAELGASLGLHIVDFEAELRGQAGGSFATETADTIVGAPLLGVYGAYALTPELVLAARVGWLNFDYEDYQINLRQALLELDWALTKHFGVNAAYHFYSADIDHEGDGDFTGEAELNFRGPRLGLSFYF